MAYDPSQEVRFAVVMYGGVSLAIYMNGAAQELLRAVRATADLPPGAKIEGSELVYREIGQRLFLGRKQGDATVSDEIRTRIVVDVLSGTSAGGINAVFLAKALAMKNKNLKDLKQMWLDKADIDTLLNDAKSGLRQYPTGDSKASLLNSTRMYGLLVEALDKMDAPLVKDEGGSPLADQIDLFVTTTDLNGLDAPIELTDNWANEKMHRMMFHFHAAGNDAGEFDRPFNRMLALAARCTSSFPAAFEPMSFGAIHPTAGEEGAYAKFFDRYGNRDAPYRDRPFADGGILDNKPFSYAIDAIRYRNTARPVDRKLLFIDPTPEHAANGAQDPLPFNFLENAVAALVTLPGYETIRAEIERINERNRYLGRLRDLRARVPKDVWAQLPSGPVDGKFEELDLDEMVKRYSAYYVPYHVINVFGVTDWLARLATRVMGFNPESDEYRAIRQIIRAWREDHYAANLGSDTTEKTENRFLLDFDMEYRLRRLHYVREKIDDMLKSSTGAVRDALKECRRKVQEQLTALFMHSLEMESPKNSPMAEALHDLSNPDYRIGEEELLYIIAPPPEDDQFERAVKLYERLKPMLEHAAERLAASLQKKFREVSEAILGKKPPAEPYGALQKEGYAQFGSEAQDSIAELLEDYNNFARRDSVMLPYLSGTGIEETGEIGIFRISPADAKLCPAGDGQPERKLAGIQLGHFGAFLSREWRQNDIMWGRLDGAERIIAALLPDAGDERLRKDLVGRAQAAILEEELTPDVLFAWLAQYVKRNIGPAASEAELRREVMSIVSRSGTDPAIVILRDLLGGGRGANYNQFAEKYYALPSGPEPKEMLDWAGRATTIAGEMFKGLKGGGTTLSSIASRLKVLGILLTQSVRFATPNSLRDVLLHYWLQLLMLVSAILIVFGPFQSKEVAAVGWTLLAIAVALAIARQTLRDFLAGGSLWKRTFTVLAVGVGVLFCGIFGVGVMTIGRWIASNKEWLVDLPHKLLKLL